MKKEEYAAGKQPLTAARASQRRIAGAPSAGISSDRRGRPERTTTCHKALGQAEAP